MRDVWRPGFGASRLTWRRLRVLVNRLPSESLTWTAIRDGMTVEEWSSLPASNAWGAWSHTDLLLGSLVDGMRRLEWTLIAVNSEKGKATAFPEPLPRPGVGEGPLAGQAAKAKREAVRTVAVLKARERAQGAQPTEEQIEAVMAELMGGDDE